MRTGMFFPASEQWLSWFTALNSWYYPHLGMRAPALNMILSPWCPGLGFGEEGMKDECSVTQVFLILTLECSTVLGAAYPWPSSAAGPWRTTCLRSLGQISPVPLTWSHRTLVSGNGMCKPEVSYCVLPFCYYMAHQPRGSFEQQQNTLEIIMEWTVVPAPS